MTEVASKLSPAEILFLEHLVSGDPERERFQELCALHPGLEGELRRTRRRVARARREDRALAPLPASGTRRYRLTGGSTRGLDADTFEARDEVLERPVLLRVAHQGTGPGTVSPPVATESLLREAAATARLDHPGIVPVHELAVDGDGRLFYAALYTQPLTETEIEHNAALLLTSDDTP